MRLLLLYLTFFCFIISQAQSFQLDTRLFATGLNQPIGIENAGDARLFIIEKAGAIAIINADGSLQNNRFLDIRERINSDGERGLLGLAFHPNYTSNGYFYVNYTDTSGNTVVSRFSVDPNDENIALENSELQLLTFAQLENNHNGGDVTFGPDGKLYIASGDGGGAGDPQGNGQDLSTLLGTIIRLDVDISTPYIPADNPFVNDNDATTRGEIWAYGLRNPFRISFDSTNGDFWIADVGQGLFEEVNKVTGNPAGINYGWRCFEGNSVFNNNGASCIDGPSPHTPPLLDYDHSNGRASVTGGYVYRGTEFPNLQGVYIFADFSSGELASIDTSNTLKFQTPSMGSLWTSFGTDFNKNLYAVSINPGNVYKIVDAIALGVSENDFSKSVTVFPNPSSQKFFISLQEQAASVSIFNLRGQQLFNSIVINGDPINIASFSNGLYIVSVKNSKGENALKKLIIANK